MTLWQAECMRMVRSRTSMATVLAAFVVLMASAIDGGMRAAQHRAHVQAAQTRWLDRLEALRGDAAIVSAGGESAATATAIFEFGRTHAPPLSRTAHGGLALSVRHFEALSPDTRVTLESRYLDSRRTEVIANPLLAALGAPDFSVVTALLLPLLVIALTSGLVQEAREQGVWRLVRAQTARPWQSVFLALTLRWIVSVVVAVIPAGIAILMLDPGGTLAAFWVWVVGTGLCGLVWIGLAGLLNFLRASSAVATLALLSLWLVTSFAAPAALGAYAKWREGQKSQLATLSTLRDIQLEAESRDSELLESWYLQHPDHRPVSVARHAFPVTFVPRYLEQDRHIVPLMREFEELRASRAARVEPLISLAPGPGLVLLADQLAGSSAQHQNDYMQAVVEAEQVWRRILVPGVMSYRGLDEGDVAALAAIRPRRGIDPNATPILLSYAIMATVLIGAIVRSRSSLLDP